MLDDIRNKMGYHIFKRKMYKEFESKQPFKNFVERSVDYLIIMPLNDSDYTNSFDVAKYFRIHKKEVTLFIPQHKVNTISLTNHYKYISYDLNDISKLGLPTKSFIQKLTGYKFDVLIDLERDNNLFLVAVTSLINSNFKVGFKKDDIDNLYNFQLVNTKINSEISYRNLLNSLKMF